MMGDLFPLKMPSSADLEEAAQELEQKATEAVPHQPEQAALFFQAAAAYRVAFEERQTREALRALLQKLTAKSIFEQVFGKGR